MSDRIKRGVAYPKGLVEAIEAKAEKEGKTFGAVVVEILLKALRIK